MKAGHRVDPVKVDSRFEWSTVGKEKSFAGEPRSCFIDQDQDSSDAYRHFVARCVERIDVVDQGSAHDLDHHPDRWSEWPGRCCVQFFLVASCMGGVQSVIHQNRTARSSAKASVHSDPPKRRIAVPAAVGYAER